MARSWSNPQFQEEFLLALEKIRLKNIPDKQVRISIENQRNYNISNSKHLMFYCKVPLQLFDCHNIPLWITNDTLYNTVWYSQLEWYIQCWYVKDMLLKSKSLVIYWPYEMSDRCYAYFEKIDEIYNNIGMYDAIDLASDIYGSTLVSL